VNGLHSEEYAANAVKEAFNLDVNYSETRVKVGGYHEYDVLLWKDEKLLYEGEVKTVKTLDERKVHEKREKTRRQLKRNLECLELKHGFISIITPYGIEMKLYKFYNGRLILIQRLYKVL
jgi:hypothetical protein